MAARSEYQRNYRKTHPRKKYFRDLYQKQIEDRLTYQHNYDILHREERMAKRQMLSKAELLDGIHPCLRKYGIKWGVPCEDYRTFVKWSIDDPVFNQLYKEWEESGFDKFLRPVVVRQVKKNGFVQENEHWDVKKNFPWWNSDKELYETVEKELDDYQAAHNKRSKEWRKKVRADFKAKQKAKEKVK